MADDHDAQPTQQTQPVRGEPITIPVPKREEIEDLIDRAAMQGHDSGEERGE